MSLHAAVLGNNLARLELLLADASVDPNALDAEGMAALHFAASYNEPTMIRALAQHPAIDLNVRNRRGNTPLHAAVANDAAAAVAALLECGGAIDADATNQWRETALSVACSSGHVACVRLLLRHGVDRTVRDRWEQTPAEVAAAHQAHAVVDLLRHVDANAGQLPPDDAAAVVATQSQRLRLRSFVLAKLIEAPLDDQRFLTLLQHAEIDLASADYYGLTVVHKLVSWNKSALLAPFLTHRRFDARLLVPVDGKDSPLHLGVQMGALESVRELMRLLPPEARDALRAARNGEQQTALEIAEAMQHGELVAVLR